MDRELQSDVAISKLVRDMGVAYSVIIDAMMDSNDQTNPAEAFVKSLLKQTVECVLLIREYCGHGFGGV